MAHPLLSNWKYRIVYGSFWLLMTGSHFLFDSELFGASIELAIIDGFWSALTFYFIGLALWLALKYSPIEHLDPLTLVFNHLAALGLILTAWLSIVYFGISLLTDIQEEFKLVFHASFYWRLILGAIYYAMTVLVYYLIRYYNNYLERLTIENEALQVAQQAELMTLRAQINPHFLFNSLNSISALTIEEPRKAREMISQLSDFLRLSLKENNEMLSSLADEMNRVSNYLNIEKVRFGDKMIVIENIDEECLQLTIPPMILQPLLENAVKYGVSERLEPTKISVTAIFEEPLLIVEVTNEIDSTAVPSKGNGIGLQNIKQRLKAMYRRDDLLEISNEKDHFKVKLKFPQHVS